MYSYWKIRDTFGNNIYCRICTCLVPLAAELSQHSMQKPIPVFFLLFVLVFSFFSDCNFLISCRFFCFVFSFCFCFLKPSL
uniref:Uncharacterized protein n=1 Tax=Anguilla anguilla TaxID=7936 RepID=A0A0E9X612_ANGAN